MSQPLDPGLLNDLPAELRAGIETQLLALAAERAARRHLEVENADLRARNAELKALNARLEHLAREFQRARFGSRSEKLGEDQLALALEDIEVAVAAAQEEQDRKVEARTGAKPARALRAPRSLPRQLPREERVLEPSDLRCPCGCGGMVRIGEDRSERLDVTPARFRVVVTMRPGYACPKGRAGVAQARAPAHLIEGGLPTEATLAHVVVSKYSEHLPLYRQAQVMARHGLAIDRSTLSDWVGRTAFHLGPIVARMAELPKRSGKLFMDETPAPVLDPGRGRTRTGYLWAMLRDDRPWGGADPPGVVFAYAPGRGGSHAEDMLKGFEGVPQVDGHAGYNRLADARRTGGAPLRLAYCWSHAAVRSSRRGRSPAPLSPMRRWPGSRCSTGSRRRSAASRPTGAAPRVRSSPCRCWASSQAGRGSRPSGCRASPRWARRSPTS
jgi:transposase